MYNLELKSISNRLIYIVSYFEPHLTNSVIYKQCFARSYLLATKLRTSTLVDGLALW
jgi:hypothetical protein